MTTVSNDDISKWASEFTDDELAEKLERVAEAPRALLPHEKSALFREAAKRVRGQDVQPVDLGGDFTFVPNAPTGTLFHPVAEDGVFLRDVTASDAADIVRVLDASPVWSYEPTGVRIEGTT